MTSSKHNSKVQIQLASIVGLIICVAFYLMGCNAGSGTLPPIHPDTMIYMKYAKGIATGNPYVYNLNDTPSTGCTSLLYPWMLALVYKLGGTANNLLVGGFMLNSLFFIGTIVFTGLFIRKLYRPALPLGLALTVFNGQLVVAHLSQTDTGLLTFASMALFTALLYRKPTFFLALMVIACISRPEGFIFASSSVFCAILDMLRSRMCGDSNDAGVKLRQRVLLGAGLAGMAVFCLTLLLNFSLTGCFQFMSVADKGYFTQYPFAGAVKNTVRDAVDIYKGYFWGLSNSGRQLYFLPLVSGFLGLSGVLLLPRRDADGRHLVELMLGFAVAAAILLVASSQWQGVDNDRYLAWITPFWTIYIAAGIQCLEQRINAPRLKPVLICILLAFQLSSLGSFAAQTHDHAVIMNRIRSFVAACGDSLPDGQRIGTKSGACGWGYYMPRHSLLNLSGITCPDFFMKNGSQSSLPVIETLKHNPAVRFDYWLNNKRAIENMPWLRLFTGNTLISDMDLFGGPEAYSLQAASWDIVEGGETPLEPPTTAKLIGTLDIGCSEHEKLFRYKTNCRLAGTRIDYGLAVNNLSGRKYAEVSRLILGSESFTVKTDPGRDLWVVLRTTAGMQPPIVQGSVDFVADTIKFGPALNLVVLVNGKEAPQPDFQLKPTSFTELVIHIPSDYLEDEESTITVANDHVSCAYWFYQ